MCDRCEPRPFPIRVTGATTRPTSTCHCVGVAMGSYDNTVSMRTPFDLNHRTDHWVTIDTCIATEIGWLWHQGVVTLNSCCGHGKLPPSVIVAEEHYDLMDALGYRWELAPSGRRAHQLTSPTERCTTPGCGGDWRYAAPGRGHIDGCKYPLPTSPTVTGDTGLRDAYLTALSNHSHADTCAVELSPAADYDCSCWRKVLVDALAAHPAPEPVAELFTYEQMLEKLGRLESIVNHVHILAGAHGHTEAGAPVVEVGALLDALNETVPAPPVTVTDAMVEIVAEHMSRLTQAGPVRDERLRDTEWSDHCRKTARAALTAALTETGAE